MWFLSSRPSRLPTPEEALPGRPDPIPTATVHDVSGARLKPPYPVGSATARFGLGCFWGAEKTFWQLPGVLVTSVGYAGGLTPNPTYEEVCTGKTGHAEVVEVVYDPAAISYERLLQTFWESHDPTQGMRQGNDQGTQYRSLIQTFDEGQAAAARASREAYQARLTAAGFGAITTEIGPATPYYFAEAYHQQYLSKVPDGYCPDHGTGVACPMPTGVEYGPSEAGSVAD